MTATSLGRGVGGVAVTGSEASSTPSGSSLTTHAEYPATVAVEEVPQAPLADEPIPFDVEAIRGDFPILERMAGEWPLVYLDSANTSQKPRVVVEAIEDHYLSHNANVARAMHLLGAEATAAFEGARATLAQFVGANRSEEIVFTKNASEALNLCAHTLGATLRPGDEILISVMEHHSNIVPWQLLAERTGAKLRWFDVTDEGRLDLDAAAPRAWSTSGPRSSRWRTCPTCWARSTRSAEIAVARPRRRRHGGAGRLAGRAPAARSTLPLGADLVAFTGHKMVGPTGIGVLWGRYDLLAALPPFLGGGEMIEVVTMTGSTYAPPPHRFEAGTPPIAQAVGLAAAAQLPERGRHGPDRRP